MYVITIHLHQTRITHAHTHTNTQSAFCVSDVPVSLKKVKVIKPGMNRQNPNASYNNNAKFKRLHLDLVSEGKKANIVVFVKSRDTSIMSLKHAQKSEVLIYS